MAFSDARNERARAETGRNAPDHGGGDPRAAAQRNTNAMAARNQVRGLGFNPRFQPRRTLNPTPSYEMSLHNMMELAKFAPSLMGGGLSTMAALAKLGMGMGPDFTGYTGNVQGPGDYDSNAGQGLMMRMGRRAGRGLQRGY